jgi:hypothetical protein
MERRGFVRWALVTVSTLCLVAMAWLGISGAIQMLPQPSSVGGIVQGMSQAAYGALSIVCIVTSVWYRRWQIPVFLAWIAMCTFAGGVAPVVWGGTRWQGGLAGGAVVLLVTSLVALLMLAGTRGADQMQPTRRMEPPGEDK